MDSLNVSHALEVLLIATLVGSMSTLAWRRLCWLVGRSKKVDKSNATFSMLSRFALGYAITAFTIASVLLFLVLMEQGGLGGTVAPVVEALSYVEVDLGY